MKFLFFLKVMATEVMDIMDTMDTDIMGNITRVMVAMDIMGIRDTRVIMGNLQSWISYSAARIAIV